MKNFFAKIAYFLSLVFGQWQWQPPQWLKFIFDQLKYSWVGELWDDLLYFSKRQPKKAGVYGGLVGVVLVGIIWGLVELKNYWNSLPQPDYVTIQVDPPYLTNPENKKIYPLTLRFSKSAAKMEFINRELTDEVTVRPEISGTWKWVDDQTLSFEPKDAVPFKSDWMVGTEYQVTLNKKMFPSHLEFASYDVRFKTPPLTIYTVSSEYYIDPRQPKNKKAIATFRMSTPIDVEDFKKRIELDYSTADGSSLGQRGRSLSPKVTFNALMTEAYVETENLEIPKTDSVVTMTISKGLRSLRGGESSGNHYVEKVSVPGRWSALKISRPQVIFARNEKFEPEQVLVFNSGIAARSEDILKAMKVYLLPANHKPPASKKIVKNYSWSSPSEVNERIKKESEVVALDMLPTETPYSVQHSFKINVPVQRSLYIEISKGIKGLGDYELGVNFADVARVPDYTPELMFMSEGTILSLSGDRKIPLLGRNIAKAEFEIGRVLPHQVNTLIASILDGSSFKSPALYGPTEDLIVERFHEDQILPMTSKTETIYFSLDMKPYLNDQKGFFFVKVKAKSAPSMTSSEPAAEEAAPQDGEGEGDGDDEEYEEAPSYADGSTRQLQDKRLIMVTDLGIIAKENVAGSTIVFVQNLRSGQPVAGASIDIIGRNGQAILSQNTDASGRANFPDLKDYKKEKRPLAIVARKAGDVSYLPFRLSERQLLHSRFDTGGVVEDQNSDQLSSMLFSDRGLYRPGDKVNIGIILRSKAPAANVKDLPLLLTVTDPRGNTLRREKLPVKVFNLQDFQFTTNESSPTGDYVVQLHLVKKQDRYQREVLIGSTTVKIEEFVPDKLKIASTLVPFKSKGWIPMSKVQAKVSLKNLFGSAAENRMVKAEYSLTPVSPSIPKYKNYVFVNPNSKDSKTVSDYLVSKQTNDQGEVDYELDLTKYQGYYLVRLRAEGFEAEGGRAVETRTSVYASQLDFLVGYKSDGSLNYINKDSERNVELIAINPDQEPAGGSIKLILNEIKYISTLVKQSDGNYKYQSVKKENEIKTDHMKIGQEGTKIKLPTDKPGDYVYIVKNDHDQELNRIDFKIIGEANLTRALDRNSELQIVLNKDDFQPGEEIELQITAPYVGAGLITIERDTIYAQKWFKSNSSSFIEKIRIPESLSGNAYVNVTLLRDIGSKEIYMSPLSFGIQPFTISLDKQKTEITLKAPEKVKPGEKLTIEYSANKASSIVLYGVDEGILQVARYQLPNPLQHFFRKRSLQVETFQLLDLLLPEYSLIQETSASGGDGGALDQGQNLNPFKAKGLAPVVFWSGVLSADSKKKTFTYDVPDYFNGNIKIMAVASSPTGIGATESSALARGDFVITPTVPVFITPSDEIQVGVSVSNQVENAQSPTDVKLSMEVGEALEVVGDAQKALSIPQGKETATSFNLKATNQLGVTDLKFLATNGSESATFKHQVSVRPVVPFMTTVTTGFTDAIPLELKLPRSVRVEKGENNLTLSSSPLALSAGLIDYLIDFPHGCTEQIVSQTMPSLALMGQKEVPRNIKKAKEAHDNLISLLRTRQTSSGGFMLYPNSTDASREVSLYVIQYLIEAQDRGLATPEDMHTAVVNYLQSSELRKVSQLSDARVLAQALYLQARYGIVPTNDLNYLTEVLDKSFKDRWLKDSIAVYLAGTYQILQKEDKGWQLLKDLALGQSSTVDYAFYYDPIVRDSLLIQMVARHYPKNLKEILSDDSLQAFLKPILNQEINTLDSASVIMAFSSLNTLAERKGFPGALKARELIGDEERMVTIQKKLISDSKLALRADKVTIDGDAKMLPLFYTLTQKGFDRVLPTKEIKNKLEVTRVLEKDGKSVTNVEMGDEIDVILRVRGTERGWIPFVVIVDLFPAGFELQRDHTVSTVGDFVDKREDRILAYTSVSEKMLEFRYRLKATHRGRFTVPPLFAESMYDRSVQYRGLAGKIEVK